MITFIYPQKTFSKQAIQSIKRGVQLKIQFIDNRKWKIFVDGKPFFTNHENDKKISSPAQMIKIFIGLFGLLSVHFYALAAGYNLEVHEEEKSLLYKHTTS